MEYLKLNHQNEFNYKDYNSKIIQLITKLKQNEKYNVIIKSLDLGNNKNIYLMNILFRNYHKWSTIHFENDNIENNNNNITNLFKIEKLIKEDDSKIKNIFSLLIHWLFFLYSELINYIYLNSEPNYFKINIIRYLLRETNNIIIKLFKSNIINSTHIFGILHFLLFLIESNFDIITDSDILYKLKNFILLKAIFNLLQETSIIIINKSKLNLLDNEEVNKNEVDEIFIFLEEFQKSKEVNNRRNIIIIINANLLTNYMHSILKIIHFQIISENEQKKTTKELSYKNKLINFYSNFIKFNYRKPKIFNELLDNLKLSFINLYNFEQNKEKILHDLFIQGFYTKLIKKIFFFEENQTSKNVSFPPFNSFFFNGFDSEISLNLQSNKNLEKSSLFFSFNIISLKDREKYPLFMIEKDFDKKNKKELRFNIYLKKSTSEDKNNSEEYDLYIYKDNVELKIDSKRKIINNSTYYFSISFNTNKIFIGFYNGKGEVELFELAKNKKIFDSTELNLTFGFNNKEGNAFSGYIGPIIMIKNPSSSKEIKINELITIILKLQNNYYNFIFLEPNSSYSLEYINHFQNHSFINKIKKKFEKINGFECVLYLNPDILNNISEISGEINILPDIGNICPYQQNYKFNNLNVTLVRHENGIIDFIMDNGLSYICLLYEYIYQFIKNYTEEKNDFLTNDKQLLFNLIVSIFKKTLFILKNVYSEANIQHFNKNLKQIYMNLFSCLKLISSEYYIMEHIIDDFFNIIINYCSYIIDFSNNKKKNLNDIDSIINNENKINNDLLKINLSFFNGWIDFLLTPELYDFNNTNTLINLFDKLSTYFSLELETEASVILNQHIYTKLLSFAPFLSDYFEVYANNFKSSDSKKGNNKINILEEKEPVLDYYLKSLRSFFENYPSKVENISNLKNLFKYINNILDDNNNICLGYYNFIKELIGNNPDLYFIDDNDDEQIKLLLSYAKQYYLNDILEYGEEKDENSIKNKKIIFNQLISVIMRIIFTKKRINKNIEMPKEFKKLIQKIDITPDLIDSITEEIKNIIDYTIGASKNKKNIRKHSRFNKKDKKDKSDKKDKQLKNYTTEEINYLSNFYSEIFDLILYFLEYPINNININNAKDLDLYEEKVYYLLELIQGMITGNIENNISIDIDAKDENNISSNNDNGLLTIDTIYCLIYFIKFYNNILLKRLYPEKYLNNFISICELCIKSCLINSNILIEVGKGSKTILEIIMDICLNYIIKSSTQFYAPKLKIEEVNNVKNENLINEQNSIINFLIKLFPNIDDKSKEMRKKYSIFYINDYLRLISEKISIENKKNSSKDINNYSECLKEFSNYKIINNYILDENKINYNFSTFFLIKLGGYNKLLIEMNVNINQNVPIIKEKIKYNELLQLIVEKMHEIYNEHEKLYSLNKDFFFKSQKTIKYQYYIEVKKRVEICLKKKDYTSVDNYIINQIFSDEKENVFNSVFSGLCKKEAKTSSLFSQSHKDSLDEIINDNNQTERKRGILYGGGRNAYSSTNLIKDLQVRDYEEENSKSPKTLAHKNSLFKNSSDLSSSLENNKKNLDSQTEDDDLELYFEEEEGASYSNKNVNNFFENKKENKKKRNTIKIKNNLFSPLYSPKLSDRVLLRKNTFISSKNLLGNLGFSEKKNNRLERSASFFTSSSKESISFSNNKDNSIEEISYINYFDMPDEYYLKNAKKELMMNIFSINFFDMFFSSENFKKLKNYYLQNFEGIQESSKLLDFPSKIKNFSNGLEPFLFLKPFPLFFTTKIFPISHKYFYDYMIKNKYVLEPLILYQKVLPDFHLENQFDLTCELIKVDQDYYGHMIGSINYNFIIFKEEKYEFYEEKQNILKKKRINDGDLDDLFSLSLITKKPATDHQKKMLNKIEENALYKKKKIKERKIVFILFNDIEEILERRFLLMWQAIEIYLKNGKSYFFNFLNKDKCQFILDKFKNNNIIKDKIHEKNYFKNQKITSEWVEERLSTYEYLLFVNKYSSRTFNDSNQYPIFPWLITNFTQNQKQKENYRNFKFPMAAQNEENQNTALSRFIDDEDNEVKFPVHFGTHYSTSSYVYYYLMREEPFTTLLIKLQGYKQENPDRMFFSLEEVLNVLATGHDNREMIPDLFYKIEHFINLNCVNFGIKYGKYGLQKNSLRVDDFNTIKNNNNNNNNKDICKYVEFIIDNRKLIDGKKISKDINEWIDNIFGVGQLPLDKYRKKCLNIFNKETYEQKTNLNKKLKKFQKSDKNDKNIEDIINKISNKIDLIISFGQTPYQLFTEKHPKYGKKPINTVEGDFEYDLYVQIWNKNIKGTLSYTPLFFIINFESGKTFLIDDKFNLEIFDSTLFNQKGNEKYDFIKYGQLQLSYIKFFNKIYIKEDKSVSSSQYYINKNRYFISTFNDKNNFNLNQKYLQKESELKLKLFSSKELDKINTSFGNTSNSNSNDIENNYSLNYNDCYDNDYISYYNLFTNKLKTENSKLESRRSSKRIKFEEEYFRFITCRYIDNTFKIYNLPKKSSNLKKDYLPMSFVCEDFVTSCCAISYNKFLVGLNNGKLIQWSIEEVNNDFSTKKQNLKSKINIKYNKQIQAHKKGINVIEINHKLGIIITAGNDNYVFIRKIYDLELLIPIKIKSKYVITMAKVSPMNFLYIVCFNKNNEKSIIFGYTLNGLCFAKSNYDFYDTLDFTKSGNIVTWIHKKEIQILYADNLHKISLYNKDLDSIQSKLYDATWIEYSYFLRKNEQDSNVKIITYSVSDKKNMNLIVTLDVSKMNCFD